VTPCDTPPCVPPNINNLLRLTIDLSRFDEQELSSVDLVRLEKRIKTVIDTIDLVSTLYGFVETISIGLGGRISFNAVEERIIEDKDLDFNLLIGQPAQEFIISDITVNTTHEACSCAEYTLESLIFNDRTIEINAANYTLIL